MSRPDRDFPLDALAWRLLRYCPPSLSDLLEHFEDIEAYHDFLRLVEEYLPDQLEEVKRAPNAATRIALFATQFRERYFPLAFYYGWDGTYIDSDLEYSDLLRCIPIPYGGVEADDYHDLEQWRAGYLLIGSLYIFSHLREWDEGIATVWVEECANHVDRHILLRLPAHGWSQRELHRLLDGTDYQAAATFADWVNNDTGNAFMDAHPEYPFVDTWEMETVQILVADWQLAEGLRDQMARLADWLEEAPTANYTQMLDFIFSREEELGPGDSPRPPGPRTLAEVFAEQEEGF